MHFMPPDSVLTLFHMLLGVHSVGIFDVRPIYFGIYVFFCFADRIGFTNAVGMFISWRIKVIACNDDDFLGLFVTNLKYVCRSFLSDRVAAEKTIGCI